MTVQQGDLYWLQANNPLEETASVPHPYVVISDNSAHQLHTVGVCALTSNIRRISLPGNVLLEAGEANLVKTSVVEVAKQATLEVAFLGTYIGILSPQRIQQILAGIQFIETAFRSKTPR